MDLSKDLCVSNLRSLISEKSILTADFNEKKFKIQEKISHFACELFDDERYIRDLLSYYRRYPKEAICDIFLSFTSMNVIDKARNHNGDFKYPIAFSIDEGALYIDIDIWHNIEFFFNGNIEVLDMIQKIVYSTAKTRREMEYFIHFSFDNRDKLIIIENEKGNHYFNMAYESLARKYHYFLYENKSELIKILNDECLRGEENGFR